MLTSEQFETLDRILLRELARLDEIGRRLNDPSPQVQEIAKIGSALAQSPGVDAFWKSILEV